MRNTLLMTGAIIAVAAAMTSATARPVTVDSFPSTCDAIGPSGDYHELGFTVAGGGPFPIDEGIIYSSETTLDKPCPSVGVDPFLDTLVVMTNFSDFAYRDLWFVSDVGGMFTNLDAGIIEVGGPTLPPRVGGFRIDGLVTPGINNPLLSESGGSGINGDEIFDSGETWRFLIQEWGAHPGGGAVPGIVEFTSIGIGGASGVAGPEIPTRSNASIIGLRIEVPVPEPATLALFGLGLAGLGFARRRKKLAA